MDVNPLHDVSCQVLEIGLFGEPFLIPGSKDYCVSSTHFPFNEDQERQELRQALQEEWLNPIKWLIGDLDGLDDIRSQQRFWIDTACQDVTNNYAVGENLLPSTTSPEVHSIVSPITATVSRIGHSQGSTEGRPAKAKDFVYGNSRNSPFPFGGVDYKAHEKLGFDGNQALEWLDSGYQLMNHPPGFPRPVLLDGDAVPESTPDESTFKDWIVRSNPTNMLESVVGKSPDASTHRNLLNGLPICPQELDTKKNDQKVEGPGTEPMLSKEEQLEAEEPSAEPSEVDSLLQNAPKPDKDAVEKAHRERMSKLLPSAKPKENLWAIQEKMDTSQFHLMLPKEDMAMAYPFELDPFQKQAIHHLENGENVFVAAHTSAGKTVVAEYAIALARKHMSRAFYTSPIKTLSNQKYRDFNDTFGDVGLLTGDTQVNPSASVLVMTTEILRSMLYKGADIVRDLEWVIFDEVHYINDEDRGHVWEEVIIMLPEHVNLVLLSATVPNSLEFADWIGRTKKRNVYVVSTSKRPVPLNFNLFYDGKQYPILEEGKLVQANHREIVNKQKEKEKKDPKLIYNSRWQKQKVENTNWARLASFLEKKELLPAVCFAFSKNRCEECAKAVSRHNLNDADEQSTVSTLMNQFLRRLNPADRNLPQVRRVENLARRGIGVHHAGLLPLMKEIVEILFQRGLIKMLFATETFAMGVNMPARTVVFASLRKHDGKNFRDLQTGEFIQMSGRAGRRGLDNCGTVLMSCFGEDGIPEEAGLKNMLLGKPTYLESKFKLKYNMILKLLHLKEFSVEEMMRRSFSELHSARLFPKHRRALLQAQRRLDVLPALEPEIEEYYRLFRKWEESGIAIMKIVQNSKSIGSKFTPGRVLVVNTADYGVTLAFVISNAKPPGKPKATFGSEKKEEEEEKWFKCLVLRTGHPATRAKATLSGLPSFDPQLFPGTLMPLGQTMDIPFSSIISICKEKIPIAPGAGTKGGPKVMPVRPGPNMYEPFATNLFNLWKGNPEGPPIMHLNDLKINDLDNVMVQEERDLLHAQLATHECCSYPDLVSKFKEAATRYDIQQEIDDAQNKLSDHNLLLMPIFDAKVSVLQRLGYISEDNTLELKGRVCSELNSSDGLLVTEMIFENTFDNLSPVECVALLSCLVCQDKAEKNHKFGDDLTKIQDSVWTIAHQLGRIQMECGVDTNAEEYPREVLNYGMLEVAYEWARGKTFAEICRLTHIQEGSLVRSFTQLDQLAREIKKCASILGLMDLIAKMEKCSVLIKRDIVFASSLYLS